MIRVIQLIGDGRQTPAAETAVAIVLAVPVRSGGLLAPWAEAAAAADLVRRLETEPPQVLHVDADPEHRVALRAAALLSPRPALVRRVLEPPSPGRRTRRLLRDGCDLLVATRRELADSLERDLAIEPGEVALLEGCGAAGAGAAATAGTLAQLHACAWLRRPGAVAGWREEAPALAAIRPGALEHARRWAAACGIEADRLLLWNPHRSRRLIVELLDLVRASRARAILLDSHPEYDAVVLQQIAARARLTALATAPTESPHGRWLRHLLGDVFPAAGGRKPRESTMAARPERTHR